MDETYLTIYRRHEEGESPASLAKFYGVRATVIHRILRVVRADLDKQRPPPPPTAPPRTVFEAIERYGDDVAFESDPPSRPDFKPSDALPGSTAKQTTLAARAAAGLPLWHDDDRLAYSEDIS